MDLIRAGDRVECVEPCVWQGYFGTVVRVDRDSIDVKGISLYGHLHFRANSLRVVEKHRSLLARILGE